MALKGLVRRKTVVEILTERKLIEAKDLKKAQELAESEGKSLQQIIVEKNMMKKPKLLKVLSDEWGVKAVDLSPMELDKEVVSIIPESVAKRHNAVPFAKGEQYLDHRRVVCDDTLRRLVEDDLGSVAVGDGQREGHRGRRGRRGRRWDGRRHTGGSWEGG